MITTVLWEDQRGQTVRGFGPHELLLSSLADDLCGDEDNYHSQRVRLSKIVVGHPKKGNGSVLAALKDELDVFGGPVVAVVDRDKAHKLWKNPLNCMQGLTKQFKASAPGEYDLIFLINHTEDLLNAALRAMSRPPLQDKPDPGKRDSILGAAVWGPRVYREVLRQSCPSFDRIVKVVAGHCAAR